MRVVSLLICFCVQLFVVGQINISNNNSRAFGKTLNTHFNDSAWLYNSTDNQNFSKKEFNDSAWLKTKTNLTEKQVEKLNFIGFAWFRKHFFVDSNLKNTPLVLTIVQKGASEIYFNGVLLQKIGKIGKTESDEERNTGEDSPLFVTPIYGADNVIAIKYSNTAYKHSYTSSGTIEAGFYIELKKSIIFYNQKIDYILLTSGIGLGLFLFFATIGLIHFLLYLFYKERKTNLYFTLFCVLYGYYFFHFFLTFSVLTNTSTIEFLNLFVFISIPFFFIILITVLYSLFYTKFPKQYKVFLISAITISILLVFFNSIMLIFSFILALIILIEVIRTLIVALKNKIKGAKIIGIGFGLFCSFFIIVLILSPLTGGIKSNSSLLSILLAIIFILSIISIPLSMSVFLAWDFAQTNKNLKTQLVKNEDLLQQTIIQQQEKQELLANQNKMLEEQVLERTSEINEQKKELQLKNVEITDSINYSKHIQLALLPEEADIIKALPNSFILYQPKDIVSGDFYWFKQIDKSAFNSRQTTSNNNTSSILIAAADCTGHGVPGALMSLIAIENLNKAVEFETEPHKLLELVNKNIKNVLKQNTEKGAKDGMDIALCKIEQISEENYTLSYSAANRPIWIVKNNVLEILEIKATKHAIGGHTDYNQVFEQHTIELQKGDSVYIFSDGYADQFGSHKNKKLTTKRFKEILLDINSLSANEQKQHLHNYINNWRGKLEQIDDILIIGLKF